MIDITQRLAKIIIIAISVFGLVAIILGIGRPLIAWEYRKKIELLKNDKLKLSKEETPWWVKLLGFGIASIIFAGAITIFIRCVWKCNCFQ